MTCCVSATVHLVIASMGVKFISISCELKGVGLAGWTIVCWGQLSVMLHMPVLVLAMLSATQQQLMQVFEPPPPVPVSVAIGNETLRISWYVMVLVWLVQCLQQGVLHSIKRGALHVYMMRHTPWQAHV